MMKDQGWRLGEKKTSGRRQRRDNFSDVKLALDDYLRKKGMLKSLREWSQFRKEGGGR